MGDYLAEYAPGFADPDARGRHRVEREEPGEGDAMVRAGALRGRADEGRARLTGVPRGARRRPQARARRGHRRRAEASTTSTRSSRPRARPRGSPISSAATTAAAASRRPRRSRATPTSRCPRASCTACRAASRSSAPRGASRGSSRSPMPSSRRRRFAARPPIPDRSTPGTRNDDARFRSTCPGCRGACRLRGGSGRAAEGASCAGGRDDDVRAARRVARLRLAPARSRDTRSTWTSRRGA